MPQRAAPLPLLSNVIPARGEAGARPPFACRGGCCEQPATRGDAGRVR
jgi:hypothetical protein